MEPPQAGFGAAAGFEEFVRAAGPGLLRFAHVLTLDRQLAEDLAQETLIRVGLAWRRVRRDGNPVGYANRTMVTTFLNSRRRRSAPVLPGPAADPGAPDPALGRVEDAAELRGRLAALPPQQRAAVVLRYLLDLPDEEIAGLLGCRPGTVRAHVSRGLATLRTAAPTPGGTGVR